VRFRLWLYNGISTALDNTTTLLHLLKDVFAVDKISTSGRTFYISVIVCSATSISYRNAKIVVKRQRLIDIIFWQFNRPCDRAADMWPTLSTDKPCVLFGSATAISPRDEILHDKTFNKDQTHYNYPPPGNKISTTKSHNALSLTPVPLHYELASFALLKCN